MTLAVIRSKYLPVLKLKPIRAEEMALPDHLHSNSSLPKIFSQGRPQGARLRMPLFAILLAISFNCYGQEDSFALLAPDNPFNDEFVIDSRDFNVFSTESLDPLIDIGLLMQEQGRHEHAVAYFKQARQVSRIQNGFYDETQIALLEAMIESEMALEDYDAVDDHYSHMEFLYRKLYSIDDPRLETGLQKVSGWLSYALSINPVGNRVDQLRKANRIYKLRLQIAERTLASNHPRFNFLLENIAICEKQLYQFLDNDGSGMKRDRQRRRPFIARID